MDRIILEGRFTARQKIYILFFIGVPLLIAGIGLIKLNIDFRNSLVLPIMLGILLLAICIACLKRGFIKINSKLYCGVFFLGRLIIKRHIDISTTPKVSVLKFSRIQKLAIFIADKPEFDCGFNAFEIHLLNEEHTKRREIISLRNPNLVNPTIQFLTSNFNLMNEVFSPKFE